MPGDKSQRKAKEEVQKMIVRMKFLTYSSKTTAFRSQKKKIRVQKENRAIERKSY